jgi:hypothetical protein
MGQAVAFFERPVSDVGDAVGNDVAAGLARRELDEQGLALIEQTPSTLL